MHITSVSIVSHTYILYILLCLEQILFELCLYLDLATKTRMILDHKVTMVHRYMFVSCCYPVHFTTELIYQNVFHIQHGKHVMCLLVSLLECGQNIGEQYRVIQW